MADINLEPAKKVQAPASPSQFIVSAGGQNTTVDPDFFYKNQESLYKNYDNPQVYGVYDYNDGDEIDDNSSYSVTSKGQTQVVDAKFMRENIGSLRDYDPEAKVSRISPYSDIEPAGAVSSQVSHSQAALNEFDQRHGEFLKAWDEADHNNVTFRANYAKYAPLYERLSKERRELAAPVYAEKAGEFQQQADAMEQNIQQFYEQNPDIKKEMFMEDVLADSPRTAAMAANRYRNDKELSSAQRKVQNMLIAKDLYQEASDVMNAPVAGNGEGIKNMGKGMWNRAKDGSFLLDVKGFVDNMGIRSVLDKIQDKMGNLNAYKNLDENVLNSILTPDEIEIVKALTMRSNAEYERKNDTAMGYTAGQGAADSIGFMASYLATGGATEAVQGAVRTWLEKLVAGNIGKAVAGTTAALTGAAFRTVATPGVLNTVSQHLVETDTDEQGNLQLIEKGKAIKQGLTDYFIENVSESMAEGLNPIKEYLGSIDGVKKFMEKIPDMPMKEFFGELERTGVGKTLRAAGFNGLPEEMLEEWYGNALRYITYDKDAFKDFATLKGQTEMLVSFLPVTLLGGAGSVAQLRKANNDYTAAEEEFKGLAFNAGYTDKQVSDFIGRLNAGGSPAEIAKSLQGLQQRMGEDNINSAKLRQAAANLMEKAGRLHAIDQNYAETNRETIARQRAEVQDLVGKGHAFWTTSTDEASGESRELVRVLTDKEGNEQFVVPGNDITMLIDPQTRNIRYTSEEMIQEMVAGGEYTDATTEMDDYLLNRAARLEGAQDKMRVQEERAQKINELRAGIHPGMLLNIGNEAVPQPVRILGGSLDGRGVRIADDATGNELDPISWDLLAQKMGRPIVVKTKEQIEAEEAAALTKWRDEVRSRVKAEVDGTQQEQQEDNSDQLVYAVDANGETMLDENGSPVVNEEATRENSLRAWAQYNDQRSNDGGASSMREIAGILNSLQQQYDELNAKLDSAHEDVGEERLAEAEASEQLRQRIEEVSSLFNEYAKRAKEQQRSQQEARYAELTDGSLSAEEVTDFIDGRVESLTKAIESAQKQKVKIADNMTPAEYKQAVQARNEEIAQMQQELDDWLAVAEMDLQANTPVAAPVSQEEADAQWYADYINKIVNEVKAKTGVADVRIINSLDELDPNNKEHKAAISAIKKGEKVMGWYDTDSNQVFAYMPNIAQSADPAGELEKTILHEAIAHKGLRQLLGNEEFDKLCDKVWKMMSPNAQKRFMQYVESNPGSGTAVYHSEEEVQKLQQRAAADEYMAFLAENGVQSMEDVSAWTKIKAAIRSVLEKLGLVDITDEEIRLLLARSQDKIKAGANFSVETAETHFNASEEVEAVLEGESGVAFGSDGEMVAENDGNNTRFNIRTWDEQGREALANYLAKQVKANRMSRATAEDMLAEMDRLTGMAKDLAAGEPSGLFGQWAYELVRTKDGTQVPLLHALKNNSDYALNIDFSTVCKKRQVLDHLMNKLIREGNLEKENLSPADVARINQIIQKHGLEIACGICFVDSRRYNAYIFANGFLDKYNPLVQSLAPGQQVAGFNYANDMKFSNEGKVDLSASAEVVDWETMFSKSGKPSGLKDYELDWKGIADMFSAERTDANGKPKPSIIDAAKAEYATNPVVKETAKKTRPKTFNECVYSACGSAEEKMAFYISQNPKLRMLAKAEDFIASEGWTNVMQYNEDLEKLWNIQKGAAGAKANEGNTQYQSDVLNKSVNGDIYDIAGYRMQSFSDFIGHMYFDYLQAFADLAAMQLPGHAYTKEPAFVKLFHRMGMKINMSLVSQVDKNLPKDYAGLTTGPDGRLAYNFNTTIRDAEGNIIRQGQTFPPEEAFALQADATISKTAGTIAVGLSREHILMMMRDPNIRMVIPYHKSGLPHGVALIYDLNEVNDYTDFQNTKVKTGSGKNGSVVKKDKDIAHKRVDQYNFILHQMSIAEDRNAAYKAMYQLFVNEDAAAVDMHKRYNELYEAFASGSMQAEMPYELSDMRADEGFLPKVAADIYLDACRKYDYTPKFEEFSGEHDYYKVLIDFSVYDSEGRYTPQEDIHFEVPENVREYIAETLQEDEDITAKRDRETSAITKDINAYLADTELRAEQDRIASKAAASVTDEEKAFMQRDIFNVGDPRNIPAIEPTAAEMAAEESNVRFRKVTDPEEIARLDSEPAIKVYRAMQVIDGKLYPPMSAKLKGKLREPIELGQWEQAEENPELAKNGKFTLNKGNGSSLAAAYNPYFHTSTTPLNDQFSSAQSRPNLVTVEVEVPESELTSGYKAEGAKDAVGKVEWKAGRVQGQLTGTREVILSRWDKPVRIVPDAEVAQRILEMFGDRQITMPSNVVTPSLRSELEKLGVPFMETDNQGNPVDNAVRFRTVYHGSAADFEKFDHSFMSSGEGGQMYGWGTYVSTVKDVAVSYAERSADRAYQEGRIEATPKDYVAAVIDKTMKDRGTGFKGAKDALLAEYDDPAFGVDSRYTKEDLENFTFRDLDKYGPRHLYEVEIPDDNGENYLHWDKPMTRRQSDKIVKALLAMDEVRDNFGDMAEQEVKSSLGFGTEGSRIEGGLNYFLGNMMDYATGIDHGAERNAKFLRSLGFVGMEVPVNRTTNPSPDQSNFVIFEEGDAQITDHIRFRSIDITPEVRDEMQVIEATARVNGTYMKAPNGADTNLSEEQWAMVRTKAFKDWFGEWEQDPANASRVVDENGEPMVVYHGTNQQVNEFSNDADKVNNTVGDPDGFYFTNDWMQAGNYSRATVKKTGEGRFNVQAAFLNLRNPVDATDAWRKNKKKPAGKRKTYGEVKREVYNTFVDGENDGYIITSNNNAWEYVAISPNQIKSATENNGEFSPEDNDIRFRAVIRRELPKDMSDSLNRIDYILSDQSRNAGVVVRAIIDDVTDRQINDLQIEGIDINGYVHSMENTAIAHNEREHGVKGETDRGQIGVVNDDYRRAIDILRNYDSVKLSEKLDAQGLPIIIYKKRYSDGIIFYLEEVRSGRKSLAFHNLYKRIPSLGGQMSNATPTVTPKATPSIQDSSADKDTNSSENSNTLMRISPQQDADYLAAVEAGDMEKAQQMVDAAAEAAGYTIRGDHGRVSKFNIFDRDKGNPEGNWGKGFYFSNNRDDVEANYANEEGPDLKQKIEQEFELRRNRNWEIDEDKTDEELREEVRNEFISAEPNIVRAALKMDNPFIVGHGNVVTDENGNPSYDMDETYLTLEYKTDEDGEIDYDSEPTGTLMDLISALNEEIESYDYWRPIDAYKLLGDTYDGMTASQFEDEAKRFLSGHEDAFTDELGELSYINEVVRAAIERAGYDGIIDNTVNIKFGTQRKYGRSMDGMGTGTTHYIAFQSQQIKETDPVTYDDNGNVIPLSERFNESSPDIRFRTVTPKDEEAYRKAIESGDEKKIKKILVAAAKEAFPNTKIVDKKGNPMVVYHGTPNAEFNVFEGDYLFFTKKQDNASEYTGKRTSMGPRYSKEGHVVPVFLNIETPLEIDVHGGWNRISRNMVYDLLGIPYEKEYTKKKDKYGYEWDQLVDEQIDTEDVCRLAKEHGYDGIIFKNLADHVWSDDYSQTDVYVAFSPNQVKSTGATYDSREGFFGLQYKYLRTTFGATKDDAGEVIPLGERFNSENDDLRFRKADTEPHLMRREEGESAEAFRDAVVRAFKNKYNVPCGIVKVPYPGKKDSYAKYNPEKKVMTIFVYPDNTQGWEIEQDLFHECLHAAYDKIGKLDTATLGDSIKDAPLLEGLAEHVRSAYHNEADYLGEYTAFAGSAMMVTGDFSPLDLASEEDRNEFETILKELNYERVSEASKRSNVPNDRGERSEEKRGTEAESRGGEEIPAGDFAGTLFRSIEEDIARDLELVNGNRQADWSDPMSLYEAMTPEDRNSVTSAALSSDMRFDNAVIPALAKMAEDGTGSDETWRNVAAALGLETNEAKMQVWEKANTGNDIFTIARRVELADRLGFNPAAREADRKAADEARFRLAQFAFNGSAANFYNRNVNYWGNMMNEAFLDMNQSVNILMEAVEQQTGRKAQAFEDVRLALNQLSSRNLADKKKFMREHLQPMWDALRAIMKSRGLTYDDLVQYVELKHGLERNKVFAKRDALDYWKKIHDEAIKATEQDDAVLQADLRKAQAKVQAARVALDAADVDLTNARINGGDVNAAALAKARATAAFNKAYAELKTQEMISNKDTDAIDAEYEMHKALVESEQDTIYLKNREKDYSGIHTWFSEYDDIPEKGNAESDEEYRTRVRNATHHRYDTLAEAEQAAEDLIHSREYYMADDGTGNMVEVRDSDFDWLWGRINNANKAILDYQLSHGTITKAGYDAVTKMFDYYVPLRGFSEDTAEDIYSYYGKGNQSDFSLPFIHAKGRSSQASSPFGWIGNMAESAIQEGNKNMAKATLYYFVQNRKDNDLISVGEQWYEPVPGTANDWRPVYPSLDGLTTAQEVADALRAFEQEMQDMGNVKRKRDLDLRNSVIRINPKSVPEHAVNVKIDGRDVVMYINGNPRAAQAINGLLNADRGGENGLIDTFKGLNRYLSSMFTSYNPEFWISNFMRDVMFSRSHMDIEGDEAMKEAYGSTVFSGEWTKALRHTMKLMKAYNADRMDRLDLGADNYLKDYYREFAELGGITGFTVLANHDEFEDMLSDYFKEKNEGDLKRAVRGVAESIMDLSEGIEQINRFAAYAAARQSGKQIEEATNWAKNISVNFNRKGSGKSYSREEVEKMVGADGKKLNKVERALVWVALNCAGFGRSQYVFFNAAIQGLKTNIDMIKANPGRAAMWLGSLFTMGVMNALLHAWLDPDDDDDYLDMPDHERRSNLLLGGKGVYLKWTLPQELAPFYALGDMVANKVLRRSPDENLAGEVFEMAVDVLPLGSSGAEGLKGVGGKFVPSYLAPFYDLAINTDYKGSRIYDDGQWTEGKPEYQRAFKSAGKPYVAASKVLNVIGGGNEYRRGKLQVNPDAVQHLVDSYVGGVGTTVNKTINTFGSLLSGEMPEVRRVPFVSRVVVDNDDKIRNSHVTDLYNYYEGIANAVKTEEKAAMKAKDADYIKKLRETDRYDIYQKMQRLDKIDKEWKKRIQGELDDKRKKELIRKQDIERAKVVNELSQPVELKRPW